MEAASAGPSRRISLTVWLALLLLAALAWAVVVQQAQGMSAMSQNAPKADSATSDMGGMSDMNDASPPAPAAPMSSAPVSLLLYLPLWVSMMIAMMFPAAAPVVSLFTAISEKRQAAGQFAASTAIFLIGYLAVWSLFGVAAYLLSLLLPALSMMAPGLRVDNPMIAGIVLIFAGVYQLSPLKQACLQHCRSPLSIILHGWRDGNAGAFRMGFGHGAYCLGCCWGLMLVLFVVGLMNVVWMVALSVVIFAEKVIPYGPLISKLTALALVIFGIFTLIAPLLNRAAG